MTNLLIYLKIVQRVSNESRHLLGLKRLGRGYFVATRLNPYNPLSYIVFFVYAFQYLFLSTYDYAVALFKDYNNPFKWI